MCTVSLIPLNNSDFVLTSNRDEAPNRPACYPEFEQYHNQQILYPMDRQSGGTWIGLSAQNRLVCLLNGGFEKHQRAANYRLSRGVVVKDLLTAPKLVEAVKTYDLSGIEPFTMALVSWEDELQFFELVWDGDTKHFKALPLEPKIWSSSTLYNAEMRAERQSWFDTLKAEQTLSPKTLLEFHQTAGAAHIDYGVIMDRGVVKTTSITQVTKHDTNVKMWYKDLKSATETLKFLNEEASCVHE